MLYAFFWVIPRHLNFICQCIWTHCLFHLHRQIGISSYLPAYEDGTDSVPIHWNIKFRWRGINQKKAYKIQNMAKFYIHGSVHRESNLITVQQDVTVLSLLHFCRQLYMFWVLTPIIRSWYSCNYSFWYWLTGSTAVRSCCWVGTDSCVNLMCGWPCIVIQCG